MSRPHALKHVKQEILEFFNSSAQTQINELKNLVTSGEPINAETCSEIFASASLCEWFIPSSKSFLPTTKVLNASSESGSFDYEYRSQLHRNSPLEKLCHFAPTLRLLYQIRHHYLFCTAAQNPNDRSPCLGIYLAILRCADPTQPRQPHQMNVNYVYARAARNLSDYFRRHPTRTLHTTLDTEICQVPLTIRDMIISQLLKFTGHPPQQVTLSFDNYHFAPQDVRTHVRISYDDTSTDVPSSHYMMPKAFVSPESFSESQSLISSDTLLATTFKGQTERLQLAQCPPRMQITHEHKRTPEVTNRNKQYRIKFDYKSKSKQKFHASIFPQEITIQTDPRQCIINILDTQSVSNYLFELQRNDLPQTTLFVQLMYLILSEYFAFANQQDHYKDETPYVNLRIVQSLNSNLIRLTRHTYNGRLISHGIEDELRLYPTIYNLLSPCFLDRNYWPTPKFRSLFQVYTPRYMTSFHLFRLLNFISYLYEYAQEMYPINKLLPSRDITISLTDFCKVYDRINVPSVRLLDYFGSIDLDHAASMHPGLYLVAKTAQQPNMVEWTKLNPATIGLKSGLHSITTLRSSYASEYDFYLTKFNISIFEEFVLNRIGYETWPRADDGNDEYDYDINLDYEIDPYVYIDSNID